MNTPTIKQSPTNIAHLLNSPQDELLTSANVIADQDNQLLSTTLDRALASPVKHSQLFELQVGEALEAIIDGTPIKTAELDEESEQLPISEFCSPTLGKLSFVETSGEITTSPAPRSHTQKCGSPNLIELQEIQNPLQSSEFLTFTDSYYEKEAEIEELKEKLPNLLFRINGDYCFDANYCKQLRGLPPNDGFRCPVCVERHAFEIKALKFLKLLYENNTMNFMDFINPEFFKLEDGLSDMYTRQKEDVIYGLNLPKANQYTDIMDYILKPASSAAEEQEKCSQIFAQLGNIDAPADNSQILPLPFFITEFIFNVPCYFAFFLFPLIRSRYRFLHPAFESKTERFEDYDTVFAKLRIGKELTDDFKTCSFSFDQVFEFFNEFIDHQPTDRRVFNCLKSFKNIAFDQETKKPVTSSCVQEAEIELFMHFVCKFHPGLEFLRPTPDFEVLYSTTVAVRCICQNDYLRAGCIDFRHFESGDLANEIWQLSRAPDVNKLLRYFSYEHFYVIYCQFWQIDTDHNNLVNRNDMLKYGAETCPFGHKCICDEAENCQCGNIYNKLIINSIFNQKQEISYEQFVKFFIYEEDKDMRIAEEYFFDLVDEDTDGYINYNDFERYYEQMELLQETHFRELKQCENIFCQMVDCACHCSGNMSTNGKISLEQIQQSHLAGNFFNILVNYQKLAQFEIKDPYSIKQPIGSLEKTHFEKYCRLMYDLMEDGDEQESLDGAGLEDI